MTDSDSYFAPASSNNQATGRGTWYDLRNEVTPFEMAPGLLFRPALGQNLMVNLVSFEPHTEAPVHAHVEEQVGFVLEGELEFEVNGEKRTLRPGMAVLIPPHTPHGARTFGTTCLELDIVSPPRQGLIDAMKAQSTRAGESE
jgi:quercetin dioxygenase-like cupin family protein